MAWSKNGPRCPNCGTPVSRRIPVIELKWRSKGRKRKLRLMAENRLLNQNDEVRCLACSSYIKYLSCRNQPDPVGRRYFRYDGRSVSPCYLVEQALHCWRQLQTHGLVTDSKPLDFFLTLDLSGFVSFWNEFASLLKQKIEVGTAKIAVNPYLKEGGK